MVQDQGDNVPAAKLVSFHQRFLVNAFLAGFCLLIVIALLYIIALVIKKVRFKNKIILGMLLFLTLDISGK